MKFWQDLTHAKQVKNRRRMDRRGWLRVAHTEMEVEKQELDLKVEEIVVMWLLMDAQTQAMYRCRWSIITTKSNLLYANERVEDFEGRAARWHHGPKQDV